MIPLGLCLFAFVSTYWAGKRSLGQGLIGLLFWGYFFGIIRANLLSTFIYFVFDAALVAFYLSQKALLTGGDKRSSMLRTWCWILMLWPAVVLLLPFQTFMVSLVGLRGAILFLPMMLAGSRLRSKDLGELNFGFAALNLIALGFAVAEYFLGLPRFYPMNAATVLIYNSVDVAGGFYRIPAIFGTSHLYGGAMAASVPYLIAGWESAQTRFARWFILAGIGAALMGVLLSATRLNFVICCGLILVTMLNGKMTRRKRVAITVLIMIMAAVALRNARFQRFKSLSDTDFVQERVAGSVNRGFFEILLDYPMGNGLGGGGTNMPYFLANQVKNPVAMENEYARILLEQGLIGLMIWLSFVVWFIGRYKKVFAKGSWASGRRLVWCLSLIGLATGAIGMGMLTAVPQTAIFLLGIGWTAVPMPEESLVPATGATASRRRPHGYSPQPALESR
jgi:hypothetical protein